METINIGMLYIITAIVVYQAMMQIHKKSITPYTPPKIEKNKRKWISTIGLLLGILGIFLSRILYFGALPTWIGVDEAGIAYDAFCFATNGTDRYGYTFPVYLINFGGGQSVLYTYIAAIFVKLFGFSISIIRLPALVFYIASIGLMYYLVSKKHTKSMAWLTAFLITICPWHIVQSRYALDCNLLAPMMIIVMIGILQSKKWWQYALTGVGIGITLYTYSLSWLILPICLLGWMGYLLYTKSITWKSILAMGIPAFLFAIPLFCFIAVHQGWMPEMQWGKISIPKLYEFRSGEIGLQNLADSFENLKKICIKGPLDATSCFYYAEWLFSFIGIGVTAWQLKKQIRNRQFVFSHFLLITVIAILVSLLLVQDMNTTKANAFYMPMLYFAALGIHIISQNKRKIWMCILLLHIVAFGAFEWYYYTEYDAQSRNEYNDTYIYNISKHIGEQHPDKEVYIVTYAVVQPYIYTVIANEIPQPEFVNTKKETLLPLKTEGNLYVRIDQVSNYHFLFGNIQTDQVEIKKNAVYVVQKYYPQLLQRLNEEIGLKEMYGEEYYIFFERKG